MPTLSVTLIMGTCQQLLGKNTALNCNNVILFLKVYRLRVGFCSFIKHVDLVLYTSFGALPNPIAFSSVDLG